MERRNDKCHSKWIMHGRLCESAMGKTHATFYSESSPPGAPLSLLKFSVLSHARHSAGSFRPPCLRGDLLRRRRRRQQLAWLEKVSNNIVNSLFDYLSGGFFGLPSSPSQSKPKRRRLVKFRRYFQAVRIKMQSAWFHKTLPKYLDTHFLLWSANFAVG